MMNFLLFLGCVFNFIVGILSFLLGWFPITVLCLFLFALSYKAMMHNPEGDNTKDIRFTYYNGDLQREEYEEEDDTPDFPGFDRSKFKFN